MLSVARGGHHLESVKILVANKADLTVTDPVGNSVLHVAAAYDNTEALRYLLSVWPDQQLAVDLTTRNKKGETPYSIALEKKSDKAIKLLEQYQERIGDISEKTTQDLLEDLLKEEEKKEVYKAKRKDKKKRHKIRHLAEKVGVSLEDMVARCQAENEEKRLQEEAHRQAEEERLRREFE